ncbi:Gfo/Idh/MocA family protein [Parafrigoribacterium soli]|uniref:Gfo/Idh/MocA family protein n=1 Tax=Parafrigoribacterium soli TaxID=3144663 RepID=UPI0032EBEA24
MTSLPQPRVTPLRGGPVLRWGVLAPGEIARDFVTTLHSNTDQRVHAVASRSAERAATFAATHGIPRSYDAYEQLVADPAIDVVYIAAPHSEHRTLALLAISAGKNVLIEKPIAVTASQAEEIAAAAASAGVFAMEAMWSRYLPQADVIAQLLEAGRLGDVQLVSVDLGWQFPFDRAARIFEPKLGGGAMLDAGVYSLWFSQFVLGAPKTVLATGSLAATGVDAQSAVALTSASGAQASITTSILVNTAGLASIYGTDARLEFESGFVFPARFRLVTADAELSWRDESGLQGRDGLAWEAVALANYVAEGRKQSPVHSLADSIALMRTIDEVRAQLGAV